MRRVLRITLSIFSLSHTFGVGHRLRTSVVCFASFGFLLSCGGDKPQYADPVLPGSVKQGRCRTTGVDRAHGQGNIYRPVVCVWMRGMMVEGYVPDRQGALDLFHSLSPLSLRLQRYQQA